MEKSLHNAIDTWQMWTVLIFLCLTFFFIGSTITFMYTTPEDKGNIFRIQATIQCASMTVFFYFLPVIMKKVIRLVYQLKHKKGHK